MPEGVCLRCGKKWYGWSLLEPKGRICTCGGVILLAKEWLRFVMEGR